MYKRHVALSFHRVREAIAAKIIDYHFINDEINPADILCKHYAHHSVCPTLKPLLFWKEGTMECLDNNALDFDEHSWDLFVLFSYVYVLWFIFSFLIISRKWGMLENT